MQTSENDNTQSEKCNYKQEESDDSSDDNDDDPNFTVPGGACSDVEESNDDGDNEIDETNENTQKKRKKSKTKKKNNTPSEVLPCSLCPKKFFKKHRLEAHIRQHNGLKVIKIYLHFTDKIAALQF